MKVATVYRPKVTHSVVNEVYPKWAPMMRYNHDADITSFKGRFFCQWNAHPEDGVEGEPAAYPTCGAFLLNTRSIEIA